LKLNSVFVIPALLAALLLSSCGEKEAALEALSAQSVPVVEPAPVAKQAGGYEPTAEERVSGITRTKEEQDKINAEAMAGTPLPQIPGEALPAAAEPAPAADAAAPVEVPAAK
jgi:hypothetical protein